MGFIEVGLIGEERMNDCEQCSMSVEDMVKGLSEGMKGMELVEDKKMGLGEME
ncbi:hypothetical protein [Staphylococcus epidermidis]|uniref:hypothetical protein n=1 Tax=Staphylococcus epidermidis TaxID=1282 RepID=UPI001642FD87|nr:hypothetical protein [Staphylococcus epidermidis]